MTSTANSRIKGRERETMDDLLAARAQVGISLAFHIVFAVIGVALPLMMLIAEALYLRSNAAAYLLLAKRWAKIPASRLARRRCVSPLRDKAGIASASSRGRCCRVRDDGPLPIACPASVSCIQARGNGSHRASAPPHDDRRNILRPGAFRCSRSSRSLSPAPLRSRRGTASQFA